jgi:hypothetical protein
MQIWEQSPSVSSSCCCQLGPQPCLLAMTFAWNDTNLQGLQTLSDQCELSLVVCWSTKLGWKGMRSDLMICWPYIAEYQYSETNVMHFLFSLLRIKGLYMFRALLAHLKEALQKQHLVYCVSVMRNGGNSKPGAANWHNTHAVTPEDEQEMLETCIGP